MIEIARGLFLGDHTHCLNLGLRQDRGIKAVLTAMHDHLNVPVDGARCLRVAGPDGPGWEPQHAAECVAFLEEVHRDQRLPTLVHCWTGKSRSVSVCVAYLWRNWDRLEPLIEGDTPEALAETLRELRGHGRTLPDRVVWAATLEYLGFGPEWL